MFAPFLIAKFHLFVQPSTLGAMSPLEAIQNIMNSPAATWLKCGKSAVAPEDSSRSKFNCMFCMVV